MKSTIIILAFLWPGLNTFAQPPAKNIQPLNVGDTLPSDLLLENVSNHPVSKIHLSDLKGKIVIFDFFATWCSSCIRSLPKLDSLQTWFGGRLQVIIVTDEPIEKITALQKKNKIFAASSLPIVTGNSQLKQLFPHRLLPHEVWIDTDGFVKAFTDENEVTAANINALLNGQLQNLPMKIDLFIADTDQYVFGNSNKETLLYRSTLSREVKGLASSAGTRQAKAGLLSRIYFINVPLRRLFQTAYGVHSSGITFPGADSLASVNYCYELLAPAMPVADMYKLMQKELLLLFPYQVHRLNDGGLKITSR